MLIVAHRKAEKPFLQLETAVTEQMSVLYSNSDAKKRGCFCVAAQFLAFHASEYVQETLLVKVLDVLPSQKVTRPDAELNHE